MNAEKTKTALTANKIFVLLLLLIMLAGLAATLFFPDDINGYENRYAYKIAPPTLSSVAAGCLSGRYDRSALVEGMDY